MPVVLTPPNLRTSLTGRKPDTAFLAQLIAERDRLPTQRLYRRAEPDAAGSTYREGLVRGVRRLSPGFFSDRQV